MYTSSYFYRGVKKNSFFDDLPYSLLGSEAMPLQQASGDIKLGSDNYAWSAGNFCFRPKKGDKNKLGQAGIMAQLIYYGKCKNSHFSMHIKIFNAILRALQN